MCSSGNQSVRSAPVSVLARVAAFGVRGYQLLLSPLKYALFGPSCGCRFQPTCSCYARESLLKYGFFSRWLDGAEAHSTLSSVASGGYDPVPDSTSREEDSIAAPFKSNLDG